MENRGGKQEGDWPKSWRNVVVVGLENGGGKRERDQQENSVQTRRRKMKTEK